MELHLTVSESAGRLTGTARTPGSDAGLAFSGALELLACIERLCLAGHGRTEQATSPTSTTTQDG
jgi:hypothetical protein